MYKSCNNEFSLLVLGLQGEIELRRARGYLGFGSRLFCRCSHSFCSVRAFALFNSSPPYLQHSALDRAHLLFPLSPLARSRPSASLSHSPLDSPSRLGLLDQKELAVGYQVSADCIAAGKGCTSSA